MRNSQWLKAYQMAPQYIPNTLAAKPLSVRGSLGPVPRELANVETEGGETVFLPDKEGLPAHYRIHGPRHHQGGVPMNIPPDSFVFSDTASMRIKDKGLQAEFGMPESKKGYTPAEIAKKYDINKYRKILQDPNVDRLQIHTAEQIIANYQVKLGKLALIQESMKGFPGGIPLVALPFLAKYNLDPEMILPTRLDTAGQMPMQEIPEARYGGMPLYQSGGQTGTPNPQQQEQLAFLPNYRTQQRMARRAERDARRNYMTQLYINELQKLLAYNSQPSDDGDAKTGVFYRQDENGNPYFVDGRGVRLKSFDDNYYGTNNTPTEKDTKIVEKDGKRYTAPVTKTSKPKFDQSKLKPSKAEAVNPGDVYEENGKYYQIGEYDSNKPIRATKSGQNILEGNFEDHKKRATEILQRLEREGAAKYHDQPYTVGGVPRKAGWEIKASAKGKMSTAEKEFLTDFLSIGAAQGQLGPDQTPEYNISLQESGGTGFYGYTDSDFYEYRYWRAKNQTGTPEDWAELSADKKLKNRKDYLYALGFDVTNDPHISKNINDPNKLYSNDFISGKTKSRLNRSITDDQGQAYTELGLTDAIEAYFDKGAFRPGLGSDKKLGLEHADAFTYDKPVTELTAEDATTVEEEAERIQKKNDPSYTSGKKYTPWWIQDIVNIAGAAQDLFSINKYRPYKAQYTPYVPEPTFYDPAREIAAIQETAGMASDVMRGMGTSAQSMGARLAQIQGTAAENIANTMGRYNNLNVGVANEFAYKRSDILNEAQLKNQQFTKQYIDEVNALNQNYDNAKRAASANLRGAYIQGVTNRAQAQVLNTLYPNYQIDPSSGGMLDFYKGMEMEAQENAGQNINDANKFVEWFNSSGLAAQEVDMGDAYDVWRGQTSMKRTKQQQANQNYYNAYQGAFPNMDVSSMYNFNQAPQEQYRRGGMYPFTYTVGYMR